MNQKLHFSFSCEMKIAVLSDIHGNVPALQAVLDDIARWRPDQIIVNGDIVNRGPFSKQVLELLHQEISKAHFLKGNHESFVLFCAENSVDVNDPEFSFRCFAQWTADQLGDHWLKKIALWQDHIDITDLDGGSSFHVTHGSRLGNRDGISARTTEEDLPAKLGEPRDLFVGSHTHKAMIREFNNNLVVNTGSVGQPLDDDARASYGQFTFLQGQWQATIRRVVYDKAQASRDFHDSGFLQYGGPIAQLIYREHEQNKMYVGPFMRAYLSDIKAGNISLQQAVTLFLEA